MINLRQRATHSTQFGLTLIELLITIVILGILSTISFQMIFSAKDTTDIMNANQASSARVRNALERLEREIREVRKTGTAYDIDTMEANKMAFIRVSDNTTATICNGTPPDCTGGANLTLNGANLIDRGISDFSLVYWRVDTDGITLLNDPPNVTTSNVRFVDISFTFSDTDVTSGQRPIAAHTRVALRN